MQISSQVCINDDRRSFFRMGSYMGILSFSPSFSWEKITKF